jgi:6-phosphogluconolactonase
MSKGAPVTWSQDGGDAAVAAHVANVLATGATMLALPGGRTPQPILGRLIASVPDWSGITVMLTDERITPPGHPASNQAMLNVALGATGARIVPLVENASVPRCDLIWLGMGEDGHVASLFPAMAIQDLLGARVIRTLPDPLPSEAPFSRLSLNWQALSEAHETLLVVRGTAKRTLLDQVLAGRPDLPVSRLIREARGPVTIYWSEA